MLGFILFSLGALYYFTRGPKLGDVPGAKSTPMPLTGLVLGRESLAASFHIEPVTNAYIPTASGATLLLAQLAQRSVEPLGKQTLYNSFQLVALSGQNALEWLKGQVSQGRAVILQLDAAPFLLLSVPAREGPSWAVAPGRALIARPQ